MSKSQHSRQIEQPVDSTFSKSDWRILAEHWYPVASCGDVRDRPVPVKLLDVNLVVYRAGEVLTVALDRCPHRGVPLSRGCIKGHALVCAYHGLNYDSEGRCVRIPAHPEVVPSDRFRLNTLPAVERYGLLWTCLRHTGATSIPPMPSWESPDHQQILPPHVDIGGSAGRQVEGFVDVAHFAFVHQNAFADADRPEVPSYETEITDFGIRSDYVSSISNLPKPLQHLAPDGFQWRRIYEIYPPFTAKLTVHFPEGGLLNILNAASPMTATTTRLFVPITRNFDTSGSVDDVYSFNAQVFAEDKDLVESQWPQDLPLEAAAEAHFGADRSSISYRRVLREMGLTFQRDLAAYA